MAVLWQSKGLGSIGHQSFCPSTPDFLFRVVPRQNRRLAGFPSKMNKNQLHDQAASTARGSCSVLYCEVHRLSRGQQNKGKMSDSETPRQVEYGYGDGPQ